MNTRLGLMITSKCDFRCDHCMFSCTSGGKHMDDETLRLTGQFIRNNSITDINIYGGEPFIDMEHFRKCMDEVYEHDQNFFISTNGSFLASPKRLEEVKDWCDRKFRYNMGEISGIRISNSRFHNKCRSDKQKSKLQQFSWVINDPYTYADHFPLDEYDDIPFIWSEPKYHSSEHMFHIDKESGYESVNPSGRALTTNVYYSGHDHELSCVLTARSEDYEELWDDVGTIQVYPNGDIAMCCYCKSGTIGNIRDFQTVEEVANATKAVRTKLRAAGKVNRNNMEETCNNCRKIRPIKKVGLIK